MKKLQILVAVGIILLLIAIFPREIDKAAETVMKPWHLPLSGKIIVIDPGHGGVDGGAVGTSEIIEKNIALSISLKTRDYLQEQGAYVIMTRETDKDLAPVGLKGYSNRKRIDLKNRVDLINSSNTDLYLSIHLNAIPVKSVKGAQVFYYPSLDENKYLASKIQEELAAHFSTADKTSKSITSVYLLKRSQPVGALVEVGFLSNPDERYLLNKVEYQEKLSSAIYRGVLRYYTDKKNSSENTNE